MGQNCHDFIHAVIVCVYGRSAIELNTPKFRRIGSGMGDTGWGKSYGGLKFPYEFFIHSHEELRLAVETFGLEIWNDNFLTQKT